MKAAGVDLLENFETPQIAATFAQMLDDWTNEPFDPFSSPLETGSPYGRKSGSNTPKLARELAKRCVGLAGDLELRSDAHGAPINRAFADVPQERRRQDCRKAARSRDHEGRRQGRDAGVLPPSGLQPEAVDVAGLGERLADPRERNPEG